jgi:hypothetical protein
MVSQLRNSLVLGLEEAFDQMNEHILGALDTKLRAKHNYLEDTVQMLREELAMRERRIVQNQEELRKVDAECKALDELLGQAKQSI